MVFWYDTDKILVASQADKKRVVDSGRMWPAAANDRRVKMEPAGGCPAASTTPTNV